MRLIELRLQHIKAFSALTLRFTIDGMKPRPWTLLLGDNASGKTTILRCLAIGMSDESSAAGLVREMKGSLVRKTRGNSEGMILVGMVDSRGQPWTLKTLLTPIVKTGDRVRQRAYRLPADEVPDGPFPKGKDPGRVLFDEFPWQKSFVCGYGAGRSIDGREEYTDYRTVDAVYTLFRYDQPLQSPELAWRRYRQRVRERESGKLTAEEAVALADQHLSKLLGQVLDMDEEGKRPILPSEGIHLYHGNRIIPLADHADGYRSVVTWLLDFVSWHLLYRKAIGIRQIRGVVLVDEIEQHLHPHWQRYLIGRLRSQFPRVQFVATTHSPLCAASAADLTADECSLIRLTFEQEEQHVVASELSLPYGEPADQILMSSAFGLPDTRNPKVGDRLAEFRRLFRKRKPSPEDRSRMQELEQSLRSTSPDLLQPQEEARLREDLRDLVAQAERLRDSGGSK